MTQSTENTHARGPARGPLVCLVGFMGAGKSTVGLALAQRLQLPFADLDQLISKASGSTIPEIFAGQGEARFRQLETEHLQALLHGGQAIVLAVGGGCYAQPENRKRLQDAGAITIFLEAPPGELWRRCLADPSHATAARPLLQNETSFRELYMQRLPQYRQARHVVPTVGKSPERVADEVAQLVRAAGESGR